jgi:hypothetical protein
MSKGTAERLKLYAEKAFNTFYNPLEFDPNKYFSVSALMSDKPLWGKHIELERTGYGVKPKTPMSDKMKTYNMLGAVAAKGLGAASIAMVAHLALRKAKNRKQQKELRHYLNAAFPIMSLDPSVRDPVREEQEQEFGIHNVRGLEEEQEKAAQETAEPSFEEGIFELQQSLADKGISVGGKPDKFEEDPTETRHEWGPLEFVMSWANEVLDKAKIVRMPMHPVLQLAVPLAAAYGTYRGLDKILDKRERKKLEELNARKRNILDAMMHSEYRRTRGQKTAEEEKDPSLARFFWTWLTKPEELRKMHPVPSFLFRGLRHPTHFAMYGVPAAFALWAIASTALAYTVAKKRFDKADPRRKRMKTLERFLRRRAISSAPPMFVSEEGFLLGSPNEPRPAGKTKQQSVRISEPEKKTEQAAVVDELDPYAALLA